MTSVHHAPIMPDHT